METVTVFIFLGFKITADGDYSHEMKRPLLLGKKAMTKPERILKSRDITVPTKSLLFKAKVFPVVMYGCESWTIKKAELKDWCLWTVVLEKTLESPLDYKEIKPFNPKRNQSWILIGRTGAEAEALYLGHLLQRTDSLEKTLMLGKTGGRRRRGWQKMVGWHHWLDGHEFE